MTRLSSDSRGLAIGILTFVAILVFAALFYIIANPAVGMIEQTMLDQADNAEATNVIQERATIWGYILLFALFTAGIYIVTRAVFESRRPG